MKEQALTMYDLRNYTCDKISAMRKMVLAIFKCVCACVCTRVCAYVYVCPWCMQVLLPQHQYRSQRTILAVTSYFLPCLKQRLLGFTADPLVSMDSPVSSCPRSAGITVLCRYIQLPVGPEDLNSGPHSYMASTLHTELSPQPVATF